MSMPQVDPKPMVALHFKTPQALETDYSGVSGDGHTTSNILKNIEQHNLKGEFYSVYIVLDVTYLFLLIFFFRGEKHRCISLIDSFLGCCLYVPWSEIEPTTLTYRNDSNQLSTPVSLSKVYATVSASRVFKCVGLTGFVVNTSLMQINLTVETFLTSVWSSLPSTGRLRGSVLSFLSGPKTDS